jgi:hypothetical protein
VGEIVLDEMLYRLTRIEELYSAPKHARNRDSSGAEFGTPPERVGIIVCASAAAAYAPVLQRMRDRGMIVRFWSDERSPLFRVNVDALGDSVQPYSWYAIMAEAMLAPRASAGVTPK